MSSGLLRHCLLAYPRAVRASDGPVILDCAYEMLEHGSSSGREVLGLLGGGLRARGRAVFGDLRCAPWRAALGRLALPLAMVNLLVWTAGADRLRDLELGRWWIVILATSLLAVAGAATRSRALMAPAALICLTTAAYAVFVEELTAAQGSRFGSSLWHFSIGVPAAMLPALIVLVACGLCVRAGDGHAPDWLRSAVGIAPAALLYAVHPNPMQSIGGAPAAEVLVLGGALLAAPLFAIWSLTRAHRHPWSGPAAAIALAIMLPEGIWIATALLPYPGPEAALLVLAAGAALGTALVIGLARAKPQSRRCS